MFTQKGRNFYEINGEVAMSPIKDRQVLFKLLQREHSNLQSALLNGTVYQTQPGANQHFSQTFPSRSGFQSIP